MGGEQFNLGGMVLHGNEHYVVRGYSRLSGDRQYLDLEHRATGDRLTVPADEAYAVPLALAPEPEPDVLTP